MAVAIAVVLTAAPAQAAEQVVELAGLKVTVWSDAGGSGARQPVIIFSHGFHGCAAQSRFLMEAFASAGYIVFAPNHRDATCGGGESTWRSRSAIPFGRPDQWSDSSYRDRADDIHHLIGAIRTDERFRDRADLSRLGLAGHSLGGYTVLGLGGAWPSWKLEGVKAVLALSPYSQPFLVRDTLKNLDAPVMYQGGTLDFGITPWLDKTQGAYDQSSEPKYFVEFERAGHLAWTNFPSSAHDDIVSYGLAFMNHYVKGEPAASSLTAVVPGVAELRYAPQSGEARSLSTPSADPADAPR